MLRSARKNERGASLRGPFLSCPCGEPFFWHRGPFLSVIARSIATKQSRLIPRRSPPGGPSDCFAALAKTGGEGGPSVCFAPLATTEGGRHCEEHSDEAISFFPSHINGKGKQIA